VSTAAAAATTTTTTTTNNNNRFIMIMTMIIISVDREWLVPVVRERRPSLVWRRASGTDDRKKPK